MHPHLPLPAPSHCRHRGPFPSVSVRRSGIGRLSLLAALGAATAAVGLAIVFGRPYLAPYLPFLATATRPDLLTHTVKYDYLPVTIVERGTLESAENREVVCKLKAGSRGTFSSTIKWVIDDGTIVTKGQLLMELDDSNLQDQYRAQSIVVERARADAEKTDQDFIITAKQNESDLAIAAAALKVAELDLEKFTGLRADYGQVPLAAVAGGPGILTERGEYKQKLDDVSGRLKLAESDLEAYRDRFAWAERSVKLGYLTASQAKVEQSKYASAMDNLEKLQKERYILENFLRQRDLTDLLTKAEVAKLDAERVLRQAKAKEIQAESLRKTALSVYQQELEKLRDVEQQLRECRLVAPQDGMVVYFKPESSRFGSTNQNLIAVGEQVREGQKLMRIPDLKRMLVNTKVHEALVSRLRGDDREPTGNFEATRVAMLLNPHAFTRLVSQNEGLLDTVLYLGRDKEYRLAREGQAASIRVDAFPNRTLSGRVRTVASVASQTDFFTSDVKVYQTLIVIDDTPDGLKPDMSAEVTIQVDPPKEPVLAVPLQAIVGGTEAGPRRKVFVVGPGGAAEREVTLGAFNDRMVEVIDGLAEGDVVVLNPKVIAGGAKTRDEPAAGKSGPGGEKKGPRPKAKG